MLSSFWISYAAFPKYPISVPSQSTFTCLLYTSTCDLTAPSRARYQATPYPVIMFSLYQRTSEKSMLFFPLPFHYIHFFISCHILFYFTILSLFLSEYVIFRRFPRIISERGKSYAIQTFTSGMPVCKDYVKTE